MTLRIALMALSGGAAIASILAMCYYDAHLWNRRQDGYGTLEVMFSLRRRWFQSEVYTPEGNRYRVLALRAMGLSWGFLALYTLSAYLL